jgi:hypothetical protein
MVLTATLQCYIVIFMNVRFFDNWTNRLRKGVLAFCMLNNIHKRKTCGYAIIRGLRRVEGLIINDGMISFKNNNLQILKKFFQKHSVVLADAL